MTSFIGKQEYNLYLFLTQEWVAEGHRHWPTCCNIFARSILKDIYLSAFIKLNFARIKNKKLWLCLSLCNSAIITSVAPILLFLLQWSDTLQHYKLPAAIQTAVNVNLSFIVRGRNIKVLFSRNDFLLKLFLATLWGQLETSFCLITAEPGLLSGIWNRLGK